MRRRPRAAGVNMVALFPARVYFAAVATVSGRFNHSSQ